jgi:hypothetical protein
MAMLRHTRSMAESGLLSVLTVVLRFPLASSRRYSRDGWCRATGLLLCALLQCSGGGCASGNRQSPVGISPCERHLHTIDSALQVHCYPPQDKYPANLVALLQHQGHILPETLTCPAATRIAPHFGGDTGTVERCVDYMYLGGLCPTSPPGLPVVICPPENHGGRGGYVLGTDHSVKWIPANDLRRMIEGIYADDRRTVVVGEALGLRSRGRYYSRAGPGIRISGDRYN